MSLNFIPAKYLLRVYNTSYVLQGIIGDFISLNINHKKNQPSSCTVVLSDESKKDLFSLDGRLEVVRAVPNWDISWYKEWEGMFIGFDPISKSDGGIVNITASFVGLEDLIARRIVGYYPDTIYSTKNGMAEAVIKDYIEENMGATATAPPRIIDGVVSDLTIEADNGYGESTLSSSGFDSLLSTITSICDDNNLCFYIEGDSDGTAGFTFKVTDGIVGNNKTVDGLNPNTGLNSYGNVPVVFSEMFDNLENPQLTTIRADEKNVIISTSTGTGSDIGAYLSSNTSAMAESIYNQREVVVNVSTQDSTYNQLQSNSELQLEKNKYKVKISFTPKQTPTSSYGNHYWFGDVITASLFGTTTNFEITEVNITIGESEEAIQLTLEEYDG